MGQLVCYAPATRPCAGGSELSRAVLFAWSSQSLAAAAPAAGPRIGVDVPRPDQLPRAPAATSGATVEVLPARYIAAIRDRQSQPRILIASRPRLFRTLLAALLALASSPTAASLADCQ